MPLRMLEPHDKFNGDGCDQQQFALAVPSHRPLRVRHLLDHWQLSGDALDNAYLDFKSFHDGTNICSSQVGNGTAFVTGTPVMPQQETT